MLFVGIQKHGPRECPASKKGAESLFNDKVKSVKVKSIYRCGPAHTIIYVLEGNSIEGVEQFFEPGMNRCVTKIFPVVEML